MSLNSTREGSVLNEDINSLSKLPKPGEMGTGKLVARLPLYCLALVRNNSQCYLLVTDLTDQKSSLFRSSQWKRSPVFSKHDSQDRKSKTIFSLKKSGCLSSSEVFVILFPLATAEEVCSKLGFDSSMIRNKDRLFLHEEYKFIDVQFLVKVAEEKYLIGLCRDTKAIKGVNDFSQSNDSRNAVHFVKRILSQFDPTHVSRIPQEVSMLASKTNKRRYEGIGRMTFFNTPSRAPSGSELLFQQHKTDDNTQAYMTQAVGQDSQSQKHSDRTEISYVLASDDREPISKESKRARRDNDLVSDAQGSRYVDSSDMTTSKDSSHKSNGSLNSKLHQIQDSQLRLNSNENASQKLDVYDSSSQLDSFLVNRVDLQVIKAVPDTIEEIGNKTVFKLEGYLRMETDASDFVIKPYCRTLKLSNLKFYFLQSLQSTDYLELEILTESEMCQFFGMNEVEDFLDNMDQRLEGIRTLCCSTRKASVNVTKRIEHRQFSRSYWTVLDTLDSLIKKTS